MIDPITTVLGGICVAVVSGAAGKYIGSNGKVSDDHCKEKQEACQNLVIVKMKNIEDKVDNLTNLINSRIGQ